MTDTGTWSWLIVLLVCFLVLCGAIAYGYWRNDRDPFEKQALDARRAKARNRTKAHSGNPGEGHRTGQ